MCHSRFCCTVLVPFRISDSIEPYNIVSSSNNELLDFQYWELNRQEDENEERVIGIEKSAWEKCKI